MLTVNLIKKTLPFGSRIPVEDTSNSVAGLKPTFEGWGPRL
jgi:hypothetical protein